MHQVSRNKTQNECLFCSSSAGCGNGKLFPQLLYKVMLCQWFICCSFTPKWPKKKKEPFKSSVLTYLVLTPWHFTSGERQPSWHSHPHSLLAYAMSNTDRKAGIKACWMLGFLYEPLVCCFEFNHIKWQNSQLHKTTYIAPDLGVHCQCNWQHERTFPIAWNHLILLVWKILLNGALIALSTLG